MGLVAFMNECARAGAQGWAVGSEQFANCTGGSGAQMKAARHSDGELPVLLVRGVSP